MRPKIKIWLILLMLSLAVGSPLQAQGDQQWTQTLLTARESGAVQGDPNINGLLWIQNDPKKEIFLQFDLSGLPAGLGKDNFKTCTLRLVAQNVVYEPPGNPNAGGQFVIVKGRLVNDNFTEQAGTEAIISLSTLSRSNNIALKATEAFRTAVYNEYAGDKKISLKLFSDSHKASTLLYSSTNSGAPSNPSNLPRLVIEYAPPTPELLDTLSWAQHQYNPEHTGRNSWTPFKNPTGFSLAKIDMPKINGSAGSIADYPLIYHGNIYLIYKVLDRNYLLGLDFKGHELWRRDIGTGTVQRSPVISPSGIFYAVTEKKIAAYELNGAGQPVASYPAAGDLTGKLAAYTDLTVGNEGSLLLSLLEGGVNYIYGFTPQLKPYVRSGPLATSEQKISTVSVGPDGRAVFAQTPKGAVIIDMTNPSQEQPITLQHDDQNPWEYYHVPVAGPGGGVMVFADFTGTANKGNVWGYTADTRIWNAAGTLIPQPVLGSNKLVYFIQGGGLQAHRYDQIGSVEAVPDAGLKTTSNLVMDGADNIYFWDNGYLHGFKADRQALFTKIPLTSEVKARNTDETGQTIEGPEQFLRLMLGPDGTLWANNKLGSALYAFKPGFAEPNLTLKQEDIHTNTIYRATGTLTVGSLKVEGGTQILLQAQQGISFASGFTLQQGAELLCRTGF
jgi:hypothetical protein